MTEKNKRKKAVLSKSTFIKGMQCPKALYLHKNRYFLRDPLSAEQLARFSRGTQVGVYAQSLFPGGVDASPKTHFQMAKSVLTTAALLEQPDVNVIYEAAFEYDEVIVALDILYQENGKWKGVEVKSSRAISDTYRWDAALQYYVITGSGLELEDFSVAYINEHYVKEGPVDVQQLFLQESLIDAVKLKRIVVGEKIRELKDVTRLKSSPPVPVGIHCNHPYPCDFRGHCWKKVPENSVFLLDGISEAQKFEWYHAGIVSVDDLAEQISGDELWSRQIQSIRDKKVMVDESALSAFLQRYENTAIFQPFVFAPVIPLFDHTSPYQPLPMGVGLGNNGVSYSEITLENYQPYVPENAVRHLLDTTRQFDYLWVFDISKVRALMDSCIVMFPSLKNEIDVLARKMRDLLTPLKEGIVVYPGLDAPLSPEKILHHFNAESIQPDNKCMIPEQADALFQKLISAPDAENNHEAEALLKTFMHSKMENLDRLLQLWRSFVR